jgi:quercetin dioxygenase-like cupin family protein
MKVAAYQAPLLPPGFVAALQLIRDRVKWCETEGVDILCCPETVLGGLSDDAECTADIAIDLAGGQLETLLAPLASKSVTVIVGFTETVGAERSTMLPPCFTTAGLSASTASASLRRQRRRKAMEIKRSGSQPSGKGPAEYFTGTVRVDPLFEAPEPARVRGAHVTFEPGARTAWHTHPLGQTLLVTFGLGWVQRWGGPVQEIRPGDVVWFSPGEKHWHGATPTTAMMHIAIQEALNGSPVDWMEKVSDEQYRA